MAFSLAAAGAVISGAGALFGGISGAKTSAPNLPGAGQDLFSVLAALSQASPALKKIQEQDLETRLDLLREFAPEFEAEIDALRQQRAISDIQRISELAPSLRAAAAEPISEDIRRRLAQQISQDLAAGGELTPDVRREVQQGIRGAQSARGTLFGRRPVAEEALFLGRESLAIRSRRQNAAQNFLRTQAALEVPVIQTIQSLAAGAQQAIGQVQQPGLTQGLLGGLLKIQGKRTELGAEQEFGVDQFRTASITRGLVGLGRAVTGGAVTSKILENL